MVSTALNREDEERGACVHVSQHLWPPGEVMTKRRPACCPVPCALRQQTVGIRAERNVFPEMVGQISRTCFESFTQKLS